MSLSRGGAADVRGSGRWSSLQQLPPVALGGGLLRHRIMVPLLVLSFVLQTMRGGRPSADTFRIARPQSRGAVRRWRSVRWLALTLVSVVAALLLNTFAVPIFSVGSGSMLPTLDVGDRVLVNKLSYVLDDVERGHIVVFNGPSGTADGPLIKRVVAVEGEVVEGRNGVVLVDGEVLAEDYLLDGDTSEFPATVVPSGHVWVMGDDRTNSRDSRWFEAVPEEAIVGRAFMTVWPLSELGTL